MIILLYGPNIYERDRKADELICAARFKYPNASYEVISDNDLPAQEGEDRTHKIQGFLSETGLFSSGKKILHIRNFLTSFDDIVLPYLRKDAVRDDVLCILSEDWQKQELSNDIKDILNGISYKKQYFAPYTISQAARVLVEEAQKNNALLDASAAQRIYEYAHMNMYESLGEVARLSLLTSTITTSLLRSLPEYADSLGIFEFAQTIASSSSLARRLMVWEYMQFQRIDSYMIFGYLAKLAKKKGLIDALARADILVKSGKLEIVQALEEIVISV